MQAKINLFLMQRIAADVISRYYFQLFLLGSPYLINYKTGADPGFPARGFKFTKGGGGGILHENETVLSQRGVRANLSGSAKVRLGIAFSKMIPNVVFSYLMLSFAKI